MAKIELVMPKMGESIMEATILKWLKNVGEEVEIDEPILEIATDKVDSDIPSPVSGVLSEILYKEDDVVEIGKVIGYITTDVGVDVVVNEPIPPAETVDQEIKEISNNNGSSSAQNVPVALAPKVSPPKPVVSISKEQYRPSHSQKFYSPLVRTIAEQEEVSIAELDAIDGSGTNGRVTKNDIIDYVTTRSKGSAFINQPTVTQDNEQKEETLQAKTTVEKQPDRIETVQDAPKTSGSLSGTTEIIEMDRMRKLISEHMTHSKQTSAHVTSFVEVDVTNIVNWREKNKVEFQNTYGEKITFTPIFMEAVVRAIKDFPMINVSLEGTKIIKKNFVNLGMAAALPSGNLIVPVIKNADHLNLLGLTKAVNNLAERARNNKLSADEIQGGTFTLTNVGTFGNVMGTPIINQPQVAIMAVGAIKKKPAVIETEMGDLIAVRQMMFLSLSYDHRIVDGFLGGSFLRKVADYLEAFDKDRSI